MEDLLDDRSGGEWRALLSKDSASPRAGNTTQLQGSGPLYAAKSVRVKRLWHLLVESARLHDGTAKGLKTISALAHLDPRCTLAQS